MIRTVDSITDDDLNLYVDGQLPRARKIEIEAYLSENPGVAARVMADLRTRDELNLLLTYEGWTGRPATKLAAERVRNGFLRDRILLRARQSAAVACLIGIGWITHAGLGPIAIKQVGASSLPPAYIEDAVMAHRTDLVRSAMASQPEAPRYDRDEIRRATSIVMPELPRDWRLRDVQVFPSKFGPTIEMAIDSNELGSLSLFAVRPGDLNVVAVTVVRNNEMKIAHWQIGETAYALSGDADENDLARAAAGLTKTLH